MRGETYIRVLGKGDGSLFGTRCWIVGDDRVQPEQWKKKVKTSNMGIENVTVLSL